MPYVIGVSSGLWGIARQKGASESLTHLGIYRKAMQSITKGVNFIQIDLDSISEFQEENLREKMRRVREMGIEYGFHGESAATVGGRADILLDSAIEEDYILTQNKLEQLINKVGDIDGKYIVYHASETPSFLMLGKTLQSTRLVDYFGNPLYEFIEKSKDELKEWILNKKEIVESGKFGITLNEYINIVKNDLKSGAFFRERVPQKVREEFNKLYEETLKKSGKKELNEKEIEEIINKISNTIKNECKKELLDNLINFLKRNDLSYGTERIALYVIAKSMELNNDALWKNIVNAGIKYYASLENKSAEEWLKERGIKKVSLDDPNFERFYKLWIPAVSAKYIWGHFEKDGGKLKKLLSKYKIIFAFESTMGEEEQTRLVNPLQIYYLAKELGNNFSIALDIEHILASNINPKVALSLLPEDGGKYIKVVHTGYPAPLQPAHLRISLGSEEQIYLYEIYHMLRKKGMGKEDICYIIFERGEETEFQETIEALRTIVNYLEKDIEPEEAKRDPKFFGIEIESFKNINRQFAIIREHALDPLAGLIVATEETHGTLGRLAIEKGKRPEEWLKERLK